MLKPPSSYVYTCLFSEKLYHIGGQEEEESVRHLELSKQLLLMVQ